VSAPTVIPPGGGEVIGDAPDRRVEILGERDGLHATWSRFGARREGADPHIHRRHHDVFYVLAGELTVLLGDEREEVVVPAGRFARVPPLVVHGFRNGGDAELRYLNFHAPGVGFADYMRALRDGGPRSFDQEPPPAEGTRPGTDAVIGDRVESEPIAVAELRIEPGEHHHVESVYVLEGELAIAAGEREERAVAGSWVDVPRGLAHSVTSSGPARYLGIRAPG
jgi:mannose-6-phosphate isomerase-like protein (cupin superfamily)